jgi:hypothetical protein
MKVCRLKKSENNCTGEFHLSGYAKKILVGWRRG